MIGPFLIKWPNTRKTITLSTSLGAHFRFLAKQILRHFCRRRLPFKFVLLITRSYQNRFNLFFTVPPNFRTINCVASYHPELPRVVYLFAGNERESAKMSNIRSISGVGKIIIIITLRLRKF